MSLASSNRKIRGARASRVLVAASRRDELPKTSKPERTSVSNHAPSKVRFGGTPKPTLGTSVLPGTFAAL